MTEIPATENTALAERAFDPLPLGAITPSGWLRRQLRIQADGLTGTLDEFWPPVADNQWLGGQHGGWERGPYYADGLVPLAYLLDDEELQAKAETWVRGFLDSQDEQGWIGPAHQASHQGDTYDPWPRFVVLKVLTQYYEATNDDAVIDAIREFCRCLQNRLAENPLDGWAKFRWQDLVVSALWLYEHTGEDWVLDLAATAADQGFDWNDHFGDLTGFAYAQPAEEWSQDSHVVNHAMGVKAPAMLYQQSGAETDKQAAYRAIEILDRFHGQATGMFSGDEILAGKDPTRGSELCSVVEFMFSLEQLVATFGDPAFADRLERVAYNALPATFTPDMWTHQYDQQVNQVLCNVASRDFDNGPDANIFGLEPMFGCCTANMHQGWPKFASHLWMDSGDGLAAVAYAPCEVQTDVDGVPVTLIENTDYPFEDSIQLTVDPDEPTTFTLHLRIPEWAPNATLELPSGETRQPEQGVFHTITREWVPDDSIELQFTPPIQVERRHQGAVSLHRGPLVFSRAIAAKEKRLRNEEEPYADRELHPTEPWNHGLDLDTTAPARSVDHHVDGPGEVPFNPENPPVAVDVEGQRVPDWQLSGNDAGSIPHSPTPSNESRQTLTLVPYGCTNLRVTEFPLLVDQS